MTKSIALISIVLGAMLCGCGAPEVRLVKTNCQRLDRDGRFAGLEFESSLEVSGLRNEQIMLQVQLMNRRGRLVRSVDDKYRAANGAVAVGKTLFVLESNQFIEDVRLTLPAGQMHLVEEDLPARARFVVMDVDGKTLATALARVPITHAEEAPAPEAAPPPQSAPPPYSSDATPPYPGERPPVGEKPQELSADKLWFLPPSNDTWPTLRGPYVSGKELLDRAYRENVSPVPLTAEEPAWFVPVGAPDESSPRALLGPCLSESDALMVVSAYRQLARRREADVDAGAPRQIPLAEGLAQQSAAPKDTLTQDPGAERGARPRPSLRRTPRPGSE
jgi:hypothetical protein